MGQSDHQKRWSWAFDCETWVSAMTPEFGSARAIAGMVKRHSPGSKTVLGGPHANALPVQSLEEAPEFDFCVAGQAEQAFPELVRAGTNPAGLSGIYYRHSDGTATGAGKAQISGSLDDLPFPAWDLFPASEQYPIMGERGCPFSCVFCSKNLTRTLTSRSIGNILREITWVKTTFRPKQITFEDETFGIRRDWTMELLDGIVSINNDAGQKFFAQSRVDTVDSGLLKKMKLAGFEYISYGIESGDPRVREAAGKNISQEQIDRAIRLSREAGLKVWLKFIIGLPEESPLSVNRTIRLACKLNPERFSAATIVAYPGSKIHAWAEKGEKGYRFLTRAWDQFDKYLSSSIELESLSLRKMKYYQLKLFLLVYLQNFRIAELIGTAVRHHTILRKIILQFLKSSRVVR